MNIQSYNRRLDNNSSSTRWGQLSQCLRILAVCEHLQFIWARLEVMQQLQQTSAGSNVNVTLVMGRHLKQARTLPAVPACLLLVFLTTIAAAAATAAGNGPEMEREAGGAARARHQHHRGLQQQQPPHLRHNRSAPLLPDSQQPPRLSVRTATTSADKKPQWPFNYQVLINMT